MSVGCAKLGPGSSGATSARWRTGKRGGGGTLNWGWGRGWLGSNASAGMTCNGCYEQEVGILWQDDILDGSRNSGVDEHDDWKRPTAGLKGNCNTKYERHRPREMAVAGQAMREEETEWRALFPPPVT